MKPSNVLQTTLMFTLAFFTPPVKGDAAVQNAVQTAFGFTNMSVAVNTSAIGVGSGDYNIAAIFCPSYQVHPFIASLPLHMPFLGNPPASMAYQLSVKHLHALLSTRRFNCLDASVHCSCNLTKCFNGGYHCNMF